MNGRPVTSMSGWSQEANAKWEKACAITPGAECSRRSRPPQTDLLTFLANYVRQKSVNPGRATPEEPGDTRAAQEWLRDQLAGFGCFDELDLWDGAPDQPNLAAVVRGRRG